MHAVDIGPVPTAERTQSAGDLFLIFAGANIVATTLQVGASLSPAFGIGAAMTLIGAGTLLGTTLVASLVPLGPRLGVPSVIAARAALGIRGAGVVAGLLYLTNLAWIAVNNVIAASACARVAGGQASVRWWAIVLGLVAAAVVAGGPRLVGRADRLAVPLLLVTGVFLTVACLRLPPHLLSRPGAGGMSWVRGLDVVIAYQVSWILMFADYSRYTRSAARATGAVFLGLALTSLWFMPLGFLASVAASSHDPGTMLQEVGLGAWGAALMALATVTTNFVNIYLSSLAWKSLFARTRDQVSVWVTGLVGAALSLASSAWLDQYTSYMLVLGGALVPVGGVLLAHFFVMRTKVEVEWLYDRGGPYSRTGGFSVPAVAAWGLGAAAYLAAGPIGGTVPALATAVGVYCVLAKRNGSLGARPLDEARGGRESRRKPFGRGPRLPERVAAGTGSRRP